jgi:hypothetical protein
MRRGYEKTRPIPTQEEITQRQCHELLSACYQNLNVMEHELNQELITWKQFEKYQKPIWDKIRLLKARLTPIE